MIKCHPPIRWLLSTKACCLLNRISRRSKITGYVVVSSSDPRRLAVEQIVYDIEPVLSQIPILSSI